ncbi:ankyrin [Anaeromyces robustus]|uniref:Ankyrin n=1 Tax=Anaeromyces robustus TaxID=1754192 RepID=A0A1Y1VQ53_9FUNG|nr:ankyrin [Anaeromyces robustus]|eukprot:ORX61273.1 ankyrin [Anaeromyces robustus]
MDSFINQLNNTIVKIGKKDFDAAKSALKHYTMINVLERFKNSCGMIRAIQADNKYALKWLQSMNVSPYVQDEEGMTVLMHAVQDKKWDKYIDPFVSDKKCLNQEDNNGRTALFYAFGNTTGLWKLREKGIDLNHKDLDGNTVLLYCCKNNYLYRIKSLFKNKVEVNAKDINGRTAAIYTAQWTESNIEYNT